MRAPLAVLLVVACRVAQPTGDDTGPPDSGPVMPICEQTCRHLLGCYDEFAEDEVADCTADFCDGVEGAQCEADIRAVLDCVTRTPCSTLVADDADYCVDEEDAVDACEDDIAVGGSSTSDGGTSSDPTPSSTWACRYEIRTRVACPGYSDVGDWEPGCIEVDGSQPDAEAECDDWTSSNTDCDASGCCYRFSYQAVEFSEGSC